MSPRLALGLVVGAGLALRLGHFLAIRATAFPDLPLAYGSSDMAVFLRWAERILAGDLLGTAPPVGLGGWMAQVAPPGTWQRAWGGPLVLWQAPFYPYWLAGLLAVSGRSLSFVLAVQLLTGALQGLVVFALARRLFDPQVGLIAAALAVAHGPLLFYQGTLLRDWLPPLIEPLALVLVLRAAQGRRARAWVAAGAVLGAAVLVKESALLALAAVVPWTVLAQRTDLRRAATAAATLLLGVGLALSPWVLRNAAVGAPLPPRSTGVWTFALGNAADAVPVGSVVPPSLSRILEHADGRPLAILEETLRTYEGDWPAFVAKQGLKLRGLADPLDVPDNLSWAYGREISPVLGLLPGHGLLLPLALVGLGWAARPARRHALLLLYGAATVVGLLYPHVIGRYRLVLVPVLAVYAAFGLVQAWRAVRARRSGVAAAYAAAVLVAAAVQHAVLALPGLRQDPHVMVHPAEYTAAAELYAHRGRFDRAAAEMERLRLRAGASPRFAAEGREAALLEGDHRVRWAERLIADGARDEAGREIDRAARAYAGHTHLAQTHYNLGLLRLRLEDRERAREHLARFLALEPTGPRAERVRRHLGPGAPTTP